MGFRTGVRRINDLGIAIALQDLGLSADNADIDNRMITAVTLKIQSKLKEIVKCGPCKRTYRGCF